MTRVRAISMTCRYRKQEVRFKVFRELSLRPSFPLPKKSKRIMAESQLNNLDQVRDALNLFATEDSGIKFYRVGPPYNSVFPRPNCRKFPRRRLPYPEPVPHCFVDGLAGIQRYILHHRSDELTFYLFLRATIRCRRK